MVCTDERLVTGILLNQALTRPLDLARLLDLALAHRILHSCRGVVLASVSRPATGASVLSYLRAMLSPEVSLQAAPS